MKIKNKWYVNNVNSLVKIVLPNLNVKLVTKQVI